MMIHEITELAGRYKQSKRVGRGPGSGLGKTCGRGHKGAGSRSGATGSIKAWREGGQVSFITRFPKRGFSNARFKKHFHLVNLDDLEARFGKNPGHTGVDLRCWSYVVLVLVRLAGGTAAGRDDHGRILAQVSRPVGLIRDRDRGTGKLLLFNVAVGHVCLR